MDTLAHRIRQRLSDLNKTQADLGRYCKLKAPSITKWVNGSTKTLSGQNLLRAAEFLECDPNWLAQGGKFLLPKLRQTEQDIKDYELTSIDAKLANYLINTSDIQSTIASIQYTEEQYRKIFGSITPTNIQITNIKADNMSGTLEPGDLVFINTAINAYDGDGIYLFLFLSHLHLKRLQMIGDTLLVIPDNRQYKSWEISSKSKKHFQVLGKILIAQSQIFQRF